MISSMKYHVNRHTMVVKNNQDLFSSMVDDDAIFFGGTIL